MALQQDSLSVGNYYTKLRSLWESLQEHKPAHTCVCGGIAPWVEYCQLEYVMHFLMGLNGSLSSIREQILSMDPIPPITKAFSLVVQDEKQKGIGASIASNDNAHAFAVKNSNDDKGKGA